MENKFVRHATYEKYYYAESIGILRLKCTGCGVTHAVIPSFSLPGTSIGTAEAEGYLQNREEGKSRSLSGVELIAEGFDVKYLKGLEKRFKIGVLRAKAFFPYEGDITKWGLEWIRSVVKTGSRPLYKINRYCLDYGVNSIFFNRFTILIFKVKNTGKRSSRKKGSAKEKVSRIDSS